MTYCRDLKLSDAFLQIKICSLEKPWEWLKKLLHFCIYNKWNHSTRLQWTFCFQNIFWKYSERRGNHLIRQLLLDLWYIKAIGNMTTRWYKLVFKQISLLCRVLFTRLINLPYLGNQVKMLITNTEIMYESQLWGEKRARPTRNSSVQNSDALKNSNFHVFFLNEI